MGLRTLGSHEESGDCDYSAILAKLPALQRSLECFSHKETFNADEFGLNYRMAPDVTVAQQRIPGRKKFK